MTNPQTDGNTGPQTDTTSGPQTGLKIGYARVSTDEQDLAAQLDALTSLGVTAERIYVDKGLTGTNRARPGLAQALAACRAGDQLVVTKLDRLARSVADAHDIAHELTTHQVTTVGLSRHHDGTWSDWRNRSPT